DAVFLYAADAGGDSDWQKVAEEVSHKLGNFFDAFIKQAALFTESTPCGCEICANADRLGLKIVVHAGEAMFHEVAGRPQVSGADVILAHRLLKNSLESHEYLLLSEQAFALMGQHLPGEFDSYEEAYEGFPNVQTHVRLLQTDYLRERDSIYEVHANEDMQTAADSYFDWALSRLGKATSDQLKDPIRAFSWSQKLFARAESLFAGIAAKVYFRRAIANRLAARGKRRVYTH
ncbi:MAG: hypothetical protein ACI915_002055, partial [Gammaproteobacteria bacterium]